VNQDTKLPAGETEKLVFELAVRRNERVTEKQFGLTIRTTGGAERVIITMKASISGVVSIMESSIVVDVDKDSTKEVVLTRRIELRTSELNLLKNAVVSVSNDLVGIVDGRVGVEDGKAFLEWNGKIGKLTQNPIDGEIYLNGPAFSQKSIEFHVRQTSAVALHPNTLIFTSANDAELVASAMLRLKKGQSATVLKEIVCQFPNGVKSNAKCTKLTEELFRLKIKADKESVKEIRNMQIDLQLQFMANSSSSNDLFLKVPSRVSW
jgi:hypothetical protein